MKVLAGRPTLDRWCPVCRARRAIRLPQHIPGVGRCMACGAVHDLCDYPPGAELDEYRAQYREREPSP